MALSIQVSQHGGPEVLECVDVEPTAPAAGEIQIAQKAVGLNFIDTYLRSGLYPPPGMPFTPGFEGAGVISAVGEGVSEFSVGDRVAYPNCLGAYAAVRNMPASQAMQLPAFIEFDTGAAMMLKAMTAEFLLHRTYKVGPGDTILVHAAAGGVGSLLCRWGAHLGATVIGTVSSEDKAAIARANNCHHPVIYTRDDFVEAVREITDGKGVDVVYDSVGKDTFSGSMQCLKNFGLLVSFGQSSGSIAPMQVTDLLNHGSLYLTRPSLMHHIADPTVRAESAQRAFNAVKQGIIQIDIGQRYPLSEVQQAHRDLESRKTTGSTVLIP